MDWDLRNLLPLWYWLSFLPLRFKQATCKHPDWEFRAREGEEEHGLDGSKRYCKRCGKVQYSQHHPYGDIRVSWHNNPVWGSGANLDKLIDDLDS